MLFVSDALRVALLTRHLPLRRVAAAVDRRLVASAVRLTAGALTAAFGIARPRLAVCGINPHAGEGAPASEERRVLLPALRALRRQGIRCEGPFAADGLFASLRAAPAAYDAIVCPTLLVRGANSDLLSRETAHLMTQRGPKAQLVEIADVGHAPTFIHDEQIAIARAFLIG